MLVTKNMYKELGISDEVYAYGKKILYKSENKGYHSTK